MGSVARGLTGVSSHTQIFALRSPCRAGTHGNGGRARRTGWGVKCVWGARQAEGHAEGAQVPR